MALSNIFPAQIFEIANPNPMPVAADANRSIDIVSSLDRTQEGVVTNAVHLFPFGAGPTSAGIAGTGFSRQHTLTMAAGVALRLFAYISSTPITSVAPAASVKLVSATNIAAGNQSANQVDVYLIKDDDNYVGAHYKLSTHELFLESKVSGNQVVYTAVPQASVPGLAAGLLTGATLSVVLIKDQLSLYITHGGVQHLVDSQTVAGWLTTSGSHTRFDNTTEYQSYFPAYGAAYIGTVSNTVVLTNFEHGIHGGIADRERFPIINKSATNAALNGTAYKSGGYAYVTVDRPCPHSLPGQTTAAIDYCLWFIERCPIADLQARVAPNWEPVACIIAERGANASVMATMGLYLDQDGMIVYDNDTNEFHVIVNTWGDISLTDTVNVQYLLVDGSVDLLHGGVQNLSGWRLLDAAIAVDPAGPGVNARGQYDTHLYWDFENERWEIFQTIGSQAKASTPGYWTWGPRYAYSTDLLTWTEVGRYIGTGPNNSFEGTCINLVGGTKYYVAVLQGAAAGQAFVATFNPTNLAAGPTMIPHSQIPNPKLTSGGQTTTGHFRTLDYPALIGGGSDYYVASFNDKPYKRISGDGIQWAIGDRVDYYAQAAVAQVDPLVPGILSAPTGQTTTSITGLAWTGASGGEGTKTAQLQVRLTSGVTADYVDVTGQTASPGSLTGLAASLTPASRTFRVRYMDESGGAPVYSNEVTGTPTALPPPDTTAPTIILGAVSTNGLTIPVTLSEAGNQGTTGLTVKVGGVLRTAILTWQSATTGLLTLSSAVYAEQSVAADYSLTGNITDTAGNELAAFTDRAVTNNSTVEVPAETGTVAAPSFDPPGGFHSGAIQVTVATTTPGADVYVTADGTVPTAQNTLTQPISLGIGNAILRAAAAKAGMTTSQIVSAEYIVTPDSESAEVGVVLRDVTVTAIRVKDRKDKFQKRAGELLTLVITATTEDGPYDLSASPISASWSSPGSPFLPKAETFVTTTRKGKLSGALEAVWYVGDAGDPPTGVPDLPLPVGKWKLWILIGTGTEVIAAEGPTITVIA